MYTNASKPKIILPSNRYLLCPYCRQQLFKSIYVGPRSSTIPLSREASKLSPVEQFVLMKQSPDLAECVCHAIHISYTEQLDAPEGSQRQLTREEESIVHILKWYMKSLRLAFDAREDV